MKCGKCELENHDSYAYCPICGVKSMASKKSSKRLISIRADKTVVGGAVVLIIGIALLCGLLIAELTSLVGFAFAFIALGLAIVMRCRQCIHINSATHMVCKYCSREIEGSWKFCSRCGSKIK